MKKENCFIELCFLIAAFVTWFPGNSVIGQQSPAIDTFIIEDNRKAVHYQGGRLVFYDGIGQNARSIADVNSFRQDVIASKQGKYFATCSQFINKTGPARIYNNKGEKISEFDLKNHWKVHAISDNGDLLALHWVTEGTTPFVARLCDIKGNFLADYNDININTHIKFASNGTPVVWGVKGGSFVSTLDVKGQFIDRHEFPYNEEWFIEDIMLSEKASIIVLVKYSREKHFPDGIIIWDIKSNSFKTVIIPEDLGVIQQFNAISPQGYFTVLKLGGDAISLIDNKKGSEILHKTIDETFADGFKFEQIWDVAVSDKGKILIMGHSEGVVGYCVLDKTGKMIISKVLTDFGNDGNTWRRFRIRELSKDKFAIIHQTNKIEIIDLK